METITQLDYILPTLFLVAGVVTDLKHKKVPNKMVLILIISAAIYQFVFFGSQGLLAGLVASVVALGLTLPLVLGKILGAGDMKLFLAFAMATQWSATVQTLIYSLFWGALLGLAQALFNKKGRDLILSTWNVATKKEKPELIELHTIPYTVALFFGFLSYLALKNTTLLGGWYG